MKSGLTLLLVCFLPLVPLTVHAQGPDRRPRPSLPEEEIEGTPAYAALSRIEVADSLLAFPSRSNRRRLISFPL